MPAFVLFFIIRPSADRQTAKLPQLVFGLVVPATQVNAFSANLISGAIAEAAAAQAADTMVYMKSGKELHASADSVLGGQLAGSFFGAFIAVTLYFFWTSAAKSKVQERFEMPAAHMWIAAAKVALGKGLPENAWLASLFTGVAFVIAPLVARAYEAMWWLPRGASFAAGK